MRLQVFSLLLLTFTAPMPRVAEVQCRGVIMVGRADVDWIKGNNTTNRPNSYLARNDTVYVLGFPAEGPIQLPPKSLAQIGSMNDATFTGSPVAVAPSPVEYRIGRDYFLLLPQSAAELQAANPAGHFTGVKEFTLPAPIRGVSHIWLIKTDGPFTTDGISDTLLRELNPGIGTTHSGNRIIVEPGRSQQPISVLQGRQQLSLDLAGRVDRLTLDREAYDSLRTTASPKLYVRRGPSGALTPLGAQDQLYAGDWVGTDAHSTATLRFLDGSVVHLQRGSAVRILGNGKYQALAGRLWLRLLDRARLRTPAGGIRGGG